MMIAGLTVNWQENGPAEVRAWGRWRFVLNSTYSRMAASAGFSPTAILPCGRTELRRTLARTGIVILTGGNDPDPSLYGRTREGCGTIDYQRPRWEIALYRAAREAGVPVLGICLGMQTIAIAEGSALIRDLPSALRDAPKVDHSGTAARPGRHLVLTEEGLIRDVLGSRAEVSSFHHQAVEAVPPGFRITARAEDGVIESMESEDGSVIGVQWHPERDGSGLPILSAMAERAAGR